ncbi:hypothetical protein DY251_12600 [Mesorhizobium denitrificans]|uniref:Uncharacterized protein n=2 Tax=Mesorhizobium denitrificans TaxID=2294114 RepID=A0A371XDS1_9HYPH|nr:hypothetical protein DY251_12600 [Mesorhizobium denitrificans]
MSLNDAQGSCSAANADYSAMWDCVRGRVANGTAGMMNNEMGIRYMAYGDALNEQYRAGQVSSAQAKYLLSQELARGNAEFNAKYHPTVCRTQVVFGTLQTMCN